MAEQIQEATHEQVELAYVDPGYTGKKPAEAARKHRIELEVVKLAQAKGALCCCRVGWVVERNFAWASRCRRLVKDHERLPETLAGLHVLVFASLMLAQWLPKASGSA